MSLGLLGRLLDRLEETMIATLMGAATLVVFAAVVHRYACDHGHVAGIEPLAGPVSP